MIRRVLFLLCVFVMVLAGCDSVNWRNNVKVTYEVTGNADNVMVNYSVGSDGVDQEKSVDLPWSIETEVRSGREIYVMARSLHEGERQLTAKIIKDGEVLDSTSVDTSFAVAIAKTKIN